MVGKSEWKREQKRTLSPPHEQGFSLQGMKKKKKKPSTGKWTQLEKLSQKDWWKG